MKEKNNSLLIHNRSSQDYNLSMIVLRSKMRSSQSDQSNSIIALIYFFMDLNMGSFFTFRSCFFGCFLSSFILGSLLSVFIFSLGFSIFSSFSSYCFLSFLDFSDGFFSQCFSIFRTSSFQFADIIKSNTLNGSLFSEDSLFLFFAMIGLFEFFVESSPSSGPSESLCF